MQRDTTQLLAYTRHHFKQSTCTLVGYHSARPFAAPFRGELDDGAQHPELIPRRINHALAYHGSPAQKAASRRFTVAWLNVRTLVEDFFFALLVPPAFFARFFAAALARRDRATFANRHTRRLNLPPVQAVHRPCSGDNASGD